MPRWKDAARVLPTYIDLTTSFARNDLSRMTEYGEVVREAPYQSFKTRPFVSGRTQIARNTIA
jgi:hypothetical protein